MFDLYDDNSTDPLSEEAMNGTNEPEDEISQTLDNRAEAANECEVALEPAKPTEMKLDQPCAAGCGLYECRLSFGHEGDHEDQGVKWLNHFEPAKAPPTPLERGQINRHKFIGKWDAREHGYYCEICGVLKEEHGLFDVGPVEGEKLPELDITENERKYSHDKVSKYPYQAQLYCRERQLLAALKENAEIKLERDQASEFAQFCNKKAAEALVLKRDYEDRAEKAELTISEQSARIAELEAALFEIEDTSIDHKAVSVSRAALKSTAVSKLKEEEG